EFAEKWEYIQGNPIKKELATQIGEYPFVATGSLREDDGQDARPTEEKTCLPDWQGKLRFHPARYAKTFETWHENIRDWCISRQRWRWHRIPVSRKTFETL